MNVFYFKTVKSVILFIIQYATLAYLIFSAEPVPSKWYLLTSYSAGLFLGLWAVFRMGITSLNAGPDPKPGARLLDSGPYRIIRHPMYAAILLVFIPLVIQSPDTIRIIVLTVLILNLLLKMNYEERLIMESMEGYRAYSEKTWRLIPYVY